MEMNELHTPSNKDTVRSIFKEIIQFALIAAFIVLPFRLFIAQPFIVNGASMDPTFASGEYLIVDQISYHFNHPSRGSVLIFKYPEDPSKYFIKRVIGLPSETVQIHNGNVTITNRDYPNGLLLDEPYIEFPKKDSIEVSLTDDEYFVMGDNRLGSSDSRAWGPVKSEYLIGRPVVRLFPLEKLSILPGAVHINE